MFLDGTDDEYVTKKIGALFGLSTLYCQLFERYVIGITI